MSPPCLAFLLSHSRIDQLARQSGNHFFHRQCCKRPSSTFYTQRGPCPSYSSACGCGQWPCSPVGDSSSSPPVATRPVQPLYSPIISAVLYGGHATRLYRLFVPIWTNFSDTHFALRYHVQPNYWSPESSAWNSFHLVLFRPLLGTSRKARPFVFSLPSLTLRVWPIHSSYYSTTS